jgi:nitrilase
MRVALWQTKGVPADKIATVQAIGPIAAAASAAGAELLVLPELWLSGYNFPDLIPSLAEPADGPASAAIAELSAKHRLAIVYGFAERGADGKVYNAAQAFGPDGGLITCYRKAHLFVGMERRLYCPGDRLSAIFAFGEWRIAIAICYDFEFPETARALALAGANLLLVPTALGTEYPAMPDTIVHARAIENQIFVAYCNHAGSEGDITYLGGSRLVAPDGSLLAAAGRGECLLITDLDLAQRAAVAPIYPYLGDLRPELYAAATGRQQPLSAMKDGNE